MTIETAHQTTSNGTPFTGKFYRRPGFLASVVVGDIESFGMKTDQLMTFYPGEVREIAAALVGLADAMEPVESDDSKRVLDVTIAPELSTADMAQVQADWWAGCFPQWTRNERTQTVDEREKSEIQLRFGSGYWYEVAMSTALRLPAGREKALVLTKLEEAMLWEQQAVRQHG